MKSTIKIFFLPLFLFSTTSIVASSKQVPGAQEKIMADISQVTKIWGRLTKLQRSNSLRSFQKAIDNGELTNQEYINEVQATIASLIDFEISFNYQNLKVSRDGDFEATNIVAKYTKYKNALDSKK